MSRTRWFLVSLAAVALVLLSPLAYQRLAGPADAQGSVPDTGLNVTVDLSRPANGVYFGAGERLEIKVNLRDKSGAPLTRGDFATLSLYTYGPQETTRTVTAVKLLNATSDRSKTPHHYIDLLKDTGVTDEGSFLKYLYQPVSDEEAGTYTVAIRAVKKGDPPVNQAFVLADFQIGTSTVEKQIVAEAKCAACHQGASNGRFYFAHVDPSARSPYGSPSIDTSPVRTCKACHNNDGYAAYTSPVDGKTRVPDQIVSRVHGVHYGEELTNPANTDPQKGLFRDYRGVVFPADVLNCTKCHTDNRWQTMPSRLACSTCHDATWFGDPAATPEKLKNHPGGPQANDASCATCHTPDTGPLAVAVVHDPAVNVEHDEAVLTMSPPANGKFYVPGEKSVVTIVIKDANGKPIDHTKVDTLFTAANFYVYGPREESKPVLTTAAKIGNSASSASATSSIAAAGTTTKGWTFDAGDTFKIAISGGAAQVLNAPTGLQTPEQVVAWLKSGLTGVNVTVSGSNVNINSTVKGDKSRIEIYNSPVTTKMGWKPGGLDIIEHGAVVGKTVGTTVEPFVLIGAPSTVANTLRGTSDPAVKRTADAITYQLDDVAGLAPGTYIANMYTTAAGVTTKNGWARSAFGLVEFQVGTATPEPKIAGNCAQCHGDTIMHLNERNVHPARYDPDGCKACHDYQRWGTGDGFSRTGGTSTSGWAGYGAKPIVARIHGVHFGAYLNHKEEVYAGNPNMASEIIFPQDIRNCTKCHDPLGSPAWKEEPSRLACMSCHDKDVDNSHAKAMTVYPNPEDPWSASREETCKICHGAGKELSPDKVHNISDPYKPPYPREPE